MEYSELIKNISKISKLTQKKFKKLIPELEQQVNFVIENKIDDINKIEHLLDDIINFHYILDVESLFSKLINYYSIIDKEGATDYQIIFNEAFNEED